MLKKNRLSKLKAVAKKIGLNNSLFSGRLIFQKSIYLLQKMGLKLGYKFTFYTNGVYSAELSQDMYTLGDIKK